MYFKVINFCITTLTWILIQNITQIIGIWNSGVMIGPSDPAVWGCQFWRCNLDNLADRLPDRQKYRWFKKAARGFKNHRGGAKKVERKKRSLKEFCSF
jgi:hypothetical protein